MVRRPGDRSPDQRGDNRGGGRDQGAEVVDLEPLLGGEGGGREGDGWAGEVGGAEGEAGEEDAGGDAEDLEGFEGGLVGHCVVWIVKVEDWGWGDVRVG